MKKYDNKRQEIVQKSIQAADGLSLGISIVVAIFLGIGIGLLLKNYTPYPWLFWLGVIIGILAAFLNIFKAYQGQVKSYQEFKERDELIAKKLKEKK
ncbi:MULTISPECIES: AtpZ/AtpI family protein [unclassified Campylobacter]|uniref:AtpZ/AtpI family protein n=1 Tax=unclassified Campylobacter TaxID=2593542 RepID=UPI001237F549|nr:MULTISPECIES: AtpZ/AtpI family protein [unclassified Campylobacter]KAA6227031.1 AtpZ/AtpI family protein [Campylobacter sp. LR196d]KAA6227602.1 AtpZ/AtpI family protein [Campylobacter sp. LR286c]